MINTAVIGLGKMGLSHCAIINAHNDTNLVAVCETSSFLLNALKKYSGMECYTDYKKMIDETQLDCLFVASPAGYHAEMVKYALERNINVFCEKPFALKIENAEELVKIAEERKLVNQVGYHNRFLGTFNYLKKLIDNKIIGEIYHFTGEAYGPVVLKEKGGTWRSISSEGGGCLYDYASHVINLINFLLGIPSNAIGSILKKIYSGQVDDAVYSNLIIENRLSGQLIVNWSDETYRKMTTRITVYGKKGKIICDSTECKIYLKEKCEKENLNKGWNIKCITDLTKSVDFYLRGEEYSAQIDYFIKHVAEKNLNNVNSFRSAYETNMIIDLIKKNAGRLS
ncbi:MAG: Gfo/Idh/MocA family oxidoreductase [Ignavibacteriaceae bacterium]